MELGGDGDPAKQALERDLVAVAAPVDQERGAGGSYAGVVERLEDGLDLVERWDMLRL